MVYLSGNLGCAKISPQIETRHCGKNSRLHTSKVPLLAHFRVSTSR